jgi:hypothetical protein
MISDEIGAKIAGTYRFARSFKGVGQHGYGSILRIVNAIPTDANAGLRKRVGDIEQAVREIFETHDHRSVGPSGVTKWMWFRRPDDWYIYDNFAARAVGAGEGSVRGMRTFFGILHAANVTALNRSIRAALDATGCDDIQELRAERIIDKGLWLMGGAAVGNGDFNSRTIEKCRTVLADCPHVHEIALVIDGIFPSDYFDLLRTAT